MTAHQARRGGGPDPTGPSRAAGAAPMCGPDSRPRRPAAGHIGHGSGRPGRAAAEAEREWDPFTRLLLLLELSGRRSWLEDLTSPDRN
ncbi:hypothetical protein [Streptomyces sp. MNU89]|uniref:hypothetical protein n=1 Tax=Streptomyces sp. MNU89 TaxID=2560025 RepID=UPI001E3E41EA|nr:hypothetical protein [Streptomyces sp. MNU89]MCC9742833.1 hypothetical protein [Streptomyces sp. MNU89]